MAKKKPAKSSIISNLNFTIDEITPLTETQRTFFENYQSDKSQILLGYAGTGKTILSLYNAIKDLDNPDSPYRRIVIVRSAVPTRDIGHLPGTVDEKGAVYELPYKKICSEIFGRDDAYEILKQKDIIRFVTTSFIRGLTIDNSIVIVDEFQSCNGHELTSLVTRIGNNSKILFCGDFAQTDLTNISEKKGAVKFFTIVQNMPNYFDINTFKVEDIVRSGLVKEFILKQIEFYPESVGK